MYARFLDEASLRLDHTRLSAVARLYDSLYEEWRRLAHAVLPEEVDEFRTTREMLDKRASILGAKASEGLEEVSPISDDLHELKQRLDSDFPLSSSETMELFQEIHGRLTSLYQREREAMTELELAVSALL